MKPYQAQMTERQLGFFRALCAPFPDKMLSKKPGRGGREMTWIDKRALENRLDSVCTPMGWRPEYTPTGRGFKCTLHILCPTDDGEWVWLAKEDGAGTEEMDAQDDDEKSAYTNALRRAAQDAWGIGRYLYEKGLPSFWAPDVEAQWDLPPIIVDEVRVPSGMVKFADVDKAMRQAADIAKAREEAIHRANAEKQTRQESVAEPASPNPEPKPAQQLPPLTSAPTPANAIDPQLLQIPAAGRSMFGWVSGLETFYSTELKVIATRIATDMGAVKFMGQWSQEVVAKVADSLIRHIRCLGNYCGELESLIDDPPTGNVPPLPVKPTPIPATNAATSTVVPAPSTTASAAPSAPPAQSTTSPNSTILVNSRNQFMAALKVYLNEVHQIPNPDVPTLKRFVAEISPDAMNGIGSTGEVMMSVAACNDPVWLNNMTDIVTEEVRKFRAQSAVATTPEVPF